MMKAVPGVNLAVNYLDNTKKANETGAELHGLGEKIQYKDSKADNDAWYPFGVLANNVGLNAEEFNVTTDDGYKLLVQHVWSNQTKEGAPVVFFQHGLFGSADYWVMHKEESAPYQVAHAGYDVWFGNNRGSVYSRGHERLDADGSGKDKAEYFDYSFYELG